MTRALVVSQSDLCLIGDLCLKVTRVSRWLVSHSVSCLIVSQGDLCLMVTHVSCLKVTRVSVPQGDSCLSVSRWLVSQGDSCLKVTHDSCLIVLRHESPWDTETWVTLRHYETRVTLRHESPWDTSHLETQVTLRHESPWDTSVDSQSPFIQELLQCLGNISSPLTGLHTAYCQQKYVETSFLYVVCYLVL